MTFWLHTLVANVSVEDLWAESEISKPYSHIHGKDETLKYMNLQRQIRQIKQQMCLLGTLVVRSVVRRILEFVTWFVSFVIVLRI